MIGKSVAHYKIIEKIGAGGMGEVYKAEDTKLKRNVALKFLPREYSSDIMAKERFIHEAQAASALDHPNICTIHEIGESEEGLSYIAMACYDGVSLREWITTPPLPPLAKVGKKGGVSTDECIKIIIQIAQGLHKAHDVGIVHRDIKPANIIITTDRTVKILDFGLAKLAGQTRLTKTGATVGTVAYMSPEQAKGGAIDHRTDIWSLGVVMYEMLSGKLPFGGDYEQAMVYSIINEEPEAITSLNEDVSPELETIINKSLSKNPEDRYQTIADLLADFKKFGEELDISFDESLPKLLARLWRKKLVRRILAVAATIVTVAVIYHLFWPKIVELPTIAVIPFENWTGDTSNDMYCKSIASLLITSLEQSDNFRVTSRERLYDLKKQLGKEDVEFPDSELGFELCRMDGVTSLVVGELHKMGEIFTTDLKVLDVKSKDIIRTAQSDGRGVESIMEQIDELIHEIVTGVADITEEEFTQEHRPIDEITTSSMEAYNYYIRGLEEHYKYQYSDAIKYLQKAVEIDTTFFAAYLLLTSSYGRQGDENLCRKTFEKAEIYAKNLSEKEKITFALTESWYIEQNVQKWDNLIIEAATKYPKDKDIQWLSSAAFWRKNQYENAITALNKAIELYPDFGSAHKQLAHMYSTLGNHKKALETSRNYARVNPGDASTYQSMGDIYFRMGDLDQAISKYKEALFIKPDFIEGLTICYAYALQENYTEALKSLDEWLSLQSGGLERYGYLERAFFYAWLGRFEKSCQDIHHVIEIDKKTGQQRRHPFLFLGNYYYENGEIDSSRHAFNQYFEIGRIDAGRDISDNQEADINGIKSFYNFGITLLDLKQGKIDMARNRLQEIEIALPKINNQYSRYRMKVLFHILSAELLLSDNQIEKAILEYEKRPSYIYSGLWNLIFSKYPFIRDIIARAYIKMGKIDKAITEYERLITFDPDSKNRYLIHPKYHYRLAKLYQETNQYDKAIKEYERFLDLWKNADAAQPDLIDAKKRLANLSKTNLI